MTTKPINFGLLVDRIHREWFNVGKVSKVGAFKALITFETKEDMEEAMGSGLDLLLNHFDEVKPWTEVKCVKRAEYGWNALEFQCRPRPLKIYPGLQKNGAQ